MAKALIAWLGAAALLSVSSASAAPVEGYGDLGSFKHEVFQVGITAAKVNVASGNLLLHSTDLNIPEAGIRIERSYNSLSDARGLLGDGWALNVGGDVRLHVSAGAAQVILHGPTGFIARFVLQEDGSYSLADDDDLDGRAGIGIERNGSDFVLGMSEDGETFTFDASGRLLERVDPSGAVTTFAYESAPSGDRVRTITGENGVAATLEYDVGGRLFKVSASSGETVTYTYNTAGRLQRAVTPRGSVSLSYGTGAACGGSPRTCVIMVNSGTAGSLEPLYTTDGRRVASMGHPFSGTLSATTFDYQPNATKVDMPSKVTPTGRRVEYHFIGVAYRVNVTQLPPAPAAALDGELEELAAEYVGGGDPIDVTLHAASIGHGIRWVGLRRRGGPLLVNHDVNCSAGCPVVTAVASAFDPGSLPEGPATLEAAARDGAGVESPGESIDVIVDKSPPTPPHTVRAGYDGRRGAVQLAWSGGADPDLPGGSPGSGSDLSEFRVQAADGTWGDWRLAPVDGPVYVPGAAGMTMSVEVRTLDAVGNFSSAMRATVVAAMEPPAFDGDFPVCPEEGTIPGGEQGWICTEDPGAAAPLLADPPPGENTTRYVWSYARSGYMKRERTIGFGRKIVVTVGHVLMTNVSSFNGRQLRITMGMDSLDGRRVSPRMRITRRTARGRATWQRVFESDGYLLTFTRKSFPFHRGRHYFYEFGWSFLPQNPDDRNPTYPDGRYRPTPVDTPTFTCNQSTWRCRFDI